MQETILNDYALAALFINRNNKEVTSENIESVFKALNKPYLPKIGKMFSMKESEFEDLLKFTAAPGPASTGAAQVVESSAGAAVKEEEEAEADADIEFDDLFG